MNGFARPVTIVGVGTTSLVACAGSALKRTNLFENLFHALNSTTDVNQLDPAHRVYWMVSQLLALVVDFYSMTHLIYLLIRLHHPPRRKEVIIMNKLRVGSLLTESKLRTPVTAIPKIDSRLTFNASESRLPALTSCDVGIIGL